MSQPLEYTYAIILIKEWMKEPYSFSNSFLDHIQVLSVLLQLCEGNYCAAMLLGGFYENEKQTDRQLEALGIDPREEDPRMGLVMEDILAWTGHLFTREETRNALSLLETKRYIDIHFILNLDVEAFNMLIHASFINNTLKSLIDDTVPSKSPPIEVKPVSSQ